MYNANNLEVGPHSENGVDVLKSNNENKMVLYYAHWCGFKKEFLPKWGNDVRNCRKATS